MPNTCQSIFKSQKPLVNPAQQLIQSFLSVTKAFGSKDSDPLKYAKQCRSLRIQMPRGSGSTFICHSAAVAGNVVITYTDDMVKNFIGAHKDLFPDSEPAVYSVFDLGTDNLNLINYDSASKFGRMINDFHRAKVIFFDVYSQYADNKRVDRLLKDCAYTHHFVMLG